MRLLLLVLALSGIMLTASADHCATWTTSAATIDTGLGLEGAPRHYVAFDEFPFSIWAYEESNGIDGLQRGDEVVDDTCHGLIRSDTIIF